MRKGGRLGMVCDLYDSKGIPVPFFGRPASTHTAVALLHLVTRTPIIFGCCLRRGPAAFEMHAVVPELPPRSGNKQRDIKGILEALTAELETVVRRHPEQYLWGHRRWR